MRIFNSMTRQKEELIPLEPNHFKIYVCGPTVYDYFHIGNARPFIVYDTLRRYLLWLGYKVTYVQNFTDIDDKVIHRAQAEGITTAELAERMIKEYFHDADGLNIMRADIHPRATESIDAIISLISTLMDKGFAYTAEDGVYFSIEQDPNYGRLSGRDIDDLMEGASERTSYSDDKRHPFDFVLWKFKREGEPSWPSPWGEGRPGWHIECSAMGMTHLGETIDIHCGGVDLTFPHHENEIAQSECATGKTFVRYWMHNGFVSIDQRKMSKSLGNFFTVRDLSKLYPYDVIRFFILQAHYRMPINFSEESLDAAVASWQRIKSSIDLLAFSANAAPETASGEDETVFNDAVTRHLAEWQDAMDDDLNTADALAAIFELVRAANTAVASGRVSKKALLNVRDAMIEHLDVLGLKTTTDQETAIPQKILDLVDERTEAKKNRDFARADAIRDEVLAKGYKIEDTPQGARVLPVDA
ncbi:MAG: cysteine--tRNA ligase [Clostridiaceae bacterium]|jgi:cysteinyl-tRNA synthetase|nr:cysteine--tRNA ligase [Clostridiaceae bacterium]